MSRERAGAHADWIFTNGRILTLDARRPRATALAVADGRLAAVGDGAEVKRWRGRRTEVLDLEHISESDEAFDVVLCR